MFTKKEPGKQHFVYQVHNILWVIQLNKDIETEGTDKLGFSEPKLYTSI